jgi:hypothetical protein
MTTKVRTALLTEVNKEWWILLLLLIVSAALSAFESANQMLLFLYILPTLFSAYLFGRRHATLTAMASVFLVVFGTFAHDMMMGYDFSFTARARHWSEILIWGSILVVTAYGTGTLFRESHQSYDGMLQLIRNIMTQNSRRDAVERLSVCAGVIAEEMGLAREQAEVVKATAMLRDVGNMDISPEVFGKVARLAATSEERNSDQQLRLLEKVLPVLMAKKKFVQFGDMPLEARIVAVAEEFDSTITAGERRSALPASVARNVIERGAGVKFDADVVAAFLRAYDSGKLGEQRGSVREEEVVAR